MVWRVYYNRRGAEPWSVDDGNQATERTCAGIVLCKCNWKTAEAATRPANPEMAPSAWIEVEARRAEIIGSKIVFVP